MEVAWRGPELSRPVFEMKKQQAWGVDAHKVLQLMMGQLQPDNTAPASVEATLDLLGEAGNSSGPNTDHNFNLTELPELDPDQPRLPPDWKTCLDLKTGKLSFVNKTTGITSENDPRKEPLNVAPLMALEPSSPSRHAHEFLGSKKSEILFEESLRTSSSSSSGASPQMLSFSAGTQIWNLQLADTNVSLLNDISCTQLAEDRDEERSNLELDLNLTAGAGSPSRPLEQEQSVCNMEMVQRALRLTDPALECRERELPIAAGALPKLSGSPALSSLTSARSDPAWSHGGSPSTSSSSSTSRSRQLADHANQVPVAGDSHTDKRQPTHSTATDAEAEAEPKPVVTKSTVTATKALVMGACTRCLMYIMLDKCDPKCPRCGSDTPLDIVASHCPNGKRQRVEPHEELDLMRK